MSATATLPSWAPPAKPTGAVDLPPLRILNSFTRKKELFIPLDKEGKKVTWVRFYGPY